LGALVRPNSAVDFWVTDDCGNQAPHANSMDRRTGSNGFTPRIEAIENLALRQQVAVFKQSVKRPRLRPRDRVFWRLLSRLWPNWRSALAIVQPETVIKWHRNGFQLYWRWKSRPGKPGRPPIEREIRGLIRRMSWENSTWGASSTCEI